MPEEAELHPIRRGCRGNRRLLPERLRRGLLFARRHGFRGRQARRRGVQGKSRRASGSVGALPRSSTGAATISGMPTTRPPRCRDAAAGLARPRCGVDAADLDHLLQPASKPSPSTGESEELNYRLLASRPGATRKPSEKDCAISARVVPLIVLSRR